MQNTFDPAKDIPELTGKVILITGGTAGLGREMIRALARHNPEHIFFTGRDSTRANAIIHELAPSQITFLPCDFGSLGSIRAAAAQFLSMSQRLDILVCSAGIMAVPPGLTNDGYELQFGINYLSHALLTHLLLPTLLRTADLPDGDARVITITSQGMGFHPSPGILFDDLRTEQSFHGFGPWRRYGQSKLANTLFAAELARRYPNITSLSIHPGVVLTGLVNSLDVVNKWFVYATTVGRTLAPEQGSYNALWGATVDKAQLQNGRYYEPVGVLSKPPKLAESEELARRLWEWTQKELLD